jgi:hypothetical protein
VRQASQPLRQEPVRLQGRLVWRRLLERLGPELRQGERPVQQLELPELRLAAFVPERRSTDPSAARRSGLQWFSLMSWLGLVDVGGPQRVAFNLVRWLCYFIA